MMNSTNITMVNVTSAVFRADYFIDNVTTSDSGTYTCTVTNPIGSDNETITVSGMDRKCTGCIQCVQFCTSFIACTDYFTVNQSLVDDL